MTSDFNSKLFAQEYFPEEVLGKYVHMNNSGLMPLNPNSKKFIEERVHETNSFGYFFDQENFIERLEKYRKNIARFFNAAAEDLSFLPSTASGISQAAFSLENKLNGKEILSLQGEYPSNAYPWIRLAERKNKKFTALEVIENGKVHWEKFYSAINKETAIICISWVQFRNALIANLKKIGKLAKENKASFVVDGIQGVGILDFNWQEHPEIDVFCFSSHKWMTGVLGQGFILMRPELRENSQPLTHGALNYGDVYDSVEARRAPHSNGRRFEAGSPNFLNIGAASAAVDFINKWNREEILQEALKNRARLEKIIKSKGHSTLELNTEFQHPTISYIINEKTHLESYSQKLWQEKISHGTLFGMLRLSPHAFHLESDFARLEEFL